MGGSELRSGCVKALDDRAKSYNCSLSLDSIEKESAGSLQIKLLSEEYEEYITVYPSPRHLPGLKLRIYSLVLFY